MESVAALPWNRWQLSCGISGNFRVEYAPLGKIEPLLTLTLMRLRFSTMRLVTEMIMMPSQHERIHNGLGHKIKQLGMNRFDLLKRD